MTTRGIETEREGLLSVVIPAFNEEQSVPLAAAAVVGVLKDAGIPYELIFVDDGSKDGTWEEIRRAAEAFPGCGAFGSPEISGKRPPSSRVWPRRREAAARSWTAIFSTRRKSLRTCTGCGNRAIRWWRA